MISFAQTHLHVTRVNTRFRAARIKKGRIHRNGSNKQDKNSQVRRVPPRCLHLHQKASRGERRNAGRGDLIFLSADRAGKVRDERLSLASLVLFHLRHYPVKEESRPQFNRGNRGA